MSQDTQTVMGAARLPRKTGSWEGEFVVRLESRMETGPDWSSRKKKREQEAPAMHVSAVHQDGIAEKDEAGTTEP